MIECEGNTKHLTVRSTNQKYLQLWIVIGNCGSYSAQNRSLDEE